MKNSNRLRRMVRLLPAAIPCIGVAVWLWNYGIEHGKLTEHDLRSFVALTVIGILMGLLHMSGGRR